MEQIEDGKTMENPQAKSLMNDIEFVIFRQLFSFNNKKLKHKNQNHFIIYTFTSFVYVNYMLVNYFHLLIYDYFIDTQNENNSIVNKTSGNEDSTQQKSVILTFAHNVHHRYE